MDENPFQSPETDGEPPPKRKGRPGHLMSVLLVVAATWLLNILLFPHVPDAMQAVSFVAIAIGLIWIVGVLGVRAITAMSSKQGDEQKSSD